MAEDFSSIELANHSNGIRVSSFASWLNSKGDSGIKWATILPVILTMFALIRAFSKKTDSEERARILLVASIALTVLVFSFNQLRWWNLYDVIALALLSTLSVCKRENSSSAIFVFKILGIGAILLPGLVVGFPSTSDAVSPAPLSLIERQTLLERDFAYYLVKHNGKRPITLFSSPSVSKAVSFYGNIDSMDWTDEQELQAAARLASATTSTEAAVLLDSLGVTHLAFPSWNSDVEQLVRLGMRLPQGAPLPRESFYTKLQRWNLPLWIHPMSYVVPKDEGFAEISLQVLSITEEQEPELAASRLADHFIEQRLIDQTKSIRETLLLYPRSLPAITAITNIDIALNDKEPLRDSLEKALSYATRRSAKNLFIDRRISLAALLFQVNEKELARSQMNDCLKDIDVETIRILTTGNIVRVIVFSNYFNIPFNDENAKALALELIPPSIRSRVLENK